MRSSSGSSCVARSSSPIAHAFNRNRIVEPTEVGGPSGSGELHQLRPEVSPGLVGHSAAAAAIPLARTADSDRELYKMGRLKARLLRRAVVHLEETVSTVSRLLLPSLRGCGTVSLRAPREARGAATALEKTPAGAAIG